MHKLKNGNLPASFKDLDYFSTPERSTRQTDLARHNRARTQFSALLPYHTFPKIWNELEAHYRNTTNKNKFKRDLQKNILQKYQDNIVCKNLRCQQCFPP
jgi:cytochrome c1